MKNALKNSILVMFCAFVCACANKTQNAESASAEVIKKDNLPAGYWSGFLLLDELKGKVAKVVVRSFPANADGTKDEGYTGLNTTSNYSPEGELLSVLNEEGRVLYDASTIHAECDLPNLIKSLDYMERPTEDIEYQYNYTYTYDDEGFVKTVFCDYFGELSGFFTDTYTYNADHEIITIMRDGNSDDVAYKSKTEITVKERDSQGNWTSRFIKNSSTESDDDGESAYSSYSIMERTITYME